MGFRTVIIKSRAKLEFRLNNLVVRMDGTEKKIAVSEINTLIVESTAISLTAALLHELVRANIKVIFCDEKRNPCAELLPYYGSHNTSKRYKVQFAWRKEIKSLVWQRIVCKKIENQSEVLLQNGFPEQAELLRGYAMEVQPGDPTNREGHAAKVYFNRILGEGNSRNGDFYLNAYLNYGYAILLSAFNREIVASGYLTQLGIWHDNEFNQFNLASDFMEPFRYIVDLTALSLKQGDENFKKKMVNLLNYETVIDGKTTTLDLAVRQFVRSLLPALEDGDVSGICFPQSVKISGDTGE